MAEFIKVSVFTPSLDDKPSNGDAPVTGTVSYAYIRHTGINIIQGVDDVRVPFKSCIIMDDIAEPLLVLETPDELLSARRFGY